MYFIRHDLKIINKTFEYAVYGEVKEERESTSAYEKRRLEREKILDERIFQMQKEVNTLINADEGVPAEVLHPSIKNLPHDSIKTHYTTLPDVEISE